MAGRPEGLHHNGAFLERQAVAAAHARRLFFFWRQFMAETQDREAILREIARKKVCRTAKWQNGRID